MVAILAGLVIFATSAFSPFQQPLDPERNLKVLPKDISDDELMVVMKSFEVALGMGCDDCHAKSADKPGKLDFKADHKNKDVAIAMMKMTHEINENYFDTPGNFKDNYLLSEYEVTCNTCHNGHEHPVRRISVPINFDEMERN